MHDFIKKFKKYYFYQEQAFDFCYILTLTFAIFSRSGRNNSYVLIKKNKE